jgi:hypothetical protein
VTRYCNLWRSYLSLSTKYVWQLDSPVFTYLHTCIVLANISRSSLIIFGFSWKLNLCNGEVHVKLASGQHVRPKRRHAYLHDVRSRCYHARDQRAARKAVLCCSSQSGGIRIGRARDNLDSRAKLVLGQHLQMVESNVDIVLTSTFLNKYSLPEKPPTKSKASIECDTFAACASMSDNTCVTACQLQFETKRPIGLA